MYERGYKSFSVFSFFNICIYVYITVSAYFTVCLNGFDHGYKCGIHNVLKSIPIQFYFSIGDLNTKFCKQIYNPPTLA